MSALKWWQKAVFYQIYPRSFADGNGDGIGDFPGMIQKLDYLQSLGIDAVWLSPHYPSPQYDCGYDVADYTNVAPEYGTLEDFKQFLEGLHKRGIRLVLDLVLNHTSDQHAWFKESRSSRDNPKRDWYIWRDGKNGGLPNNWSAGFSGPAWEPDPLTGQYYYHFFFKQQPDLNWRNPEVKQAMWDVVRFWLDLGVDGFRLDAIGTIFEEDTIPDHPVPYLLAELRQMQSKVSSPEEHKTIRKLWDQVYQYQTRQPGMHALMQELRTVVEDYGDIVLIGEDEDLSYHGNGENELSMVFNFPLMHPPRLTPAWVRRNQKKRLTALAKISPHAWPCNTLGNHDSPRIYNRYGDGIHDAALARLSLVLILTLKGTPFLYNGEEIGMTDWLVNDISQFRDMLEIQQYQIAITEFGQSPKDALLLAAKDGRDKNRTPMQWVNLANGGFCPPEVTPWLPVNPNFALGVNVADQDSDSGSLLHFYRRLLHLRREMPALIEGNYQLLRPYSKKTLTFLRVGTHQTFLVALNFSEKPQRLEFNSFNGQLSKKSLGKITRFFSNCENSQEEIHKNKLQLAPFEIWIGEFH